MKFAAVVVIVCAVLFVLMPRRPPPRCNVGAVAALFTNCVLPDR